MQIKLDLIFGKYFLSSKETHEPKKVKDMKNAFNEDT